ncbi:MAG: hypothetical protein DMG31_15130 [Acidobacteria bacterium]|nr:MAG: hypothetical protein DMG31_15130 [Acidobacteriota bacterium]
MRAVTLLFHDVVPAGRWELSGFRGADADLYKLDCAKFRQHFMAISQSLRSQPTTGPEVLVGPSDDHPVLLTFDDGGVSALLYVADILDEFGWKAHFLITVVTPDTHGSLFEGGTKYRMETKRALVDRNPRRTDTSGLCARWVLFAPCCLRCGNGWHQTAVQLGASDQVARR